MERIAHHVDGAALAPSSGGWLAKTAPATGKTVAEIARGDAADVDRAVEAAERALTGEWAGWGVRERAELCDRVARRIADRAEALARLESADTGKPIALARSMDVPRAIDNFRFFASAIRQHEDGFHEMQGAINYTLRRPLGVVGLITPWNLPLYLLSWKAAPALAMGNAVVAKPSELTPRTASALAEILSECGAPAGVFNVVHGLGPEAGQALVEHPRVRAISFTGGTATGAKVAAASAPSFKKLSLELGGKNPTLVFADADFDAAVEGSLAAAFRNQGQICLCGSRILVERPIFDRFLESFVDKAKALVVGDPSDERTQLGALISLAHRDKIESYVELAREEGGRILCGGRRPQLGGALAAGAFYEPTVLVDLAATSRCAQEEIFGPVVSIHAFDASEEAVRIANGVRYGLSASIWTRDLERAHAVSAQLDVGMVWVNTWLLRDLRVPFGGSKESGVGREGGRWSLEFFSEAKNVCIRLSEGGRAGR
jgi:aminomuconate-semialdehyde/2-hydroxymuconate-6-semialdehyde dehydrogenase